MPMIAALALLLSTEPDLGWLAGTWCTTANAEGSRSCETWAFENGAWTGISEAHLPYIPPKLLERMRISAVDGRLVFHAKPTGQEAADFVATEAQPAMTLRFENRAHDYPQVVRYWREGDTLMAEISLADGSKPRRWTYRREKE